MVNKQRDPNRVLRAIFAAARERGVTHEELHDTIWISWQKRSLKDLTAEQAGLLIDGLRGKQAQPRREHRRSFAPGRRDAMSAHGRRDYDASGDPAYLVNAREIEMLREAAELRGWGEATLRNFIARQIGRNDIRTMAEFNKVFWALKAMNRREGLCK